MGERSDDSFDLDEEFLSESDDEERDLDRLIVVERRPKPAKNGRSPAAQAAWSRVEDVLAERRLQRELTEFLDGEDV